MRARAINTTVFHLLSLATWKHVFSVNVNGERHLMKMFFSYVIKPLEFRSRRLFPSSALDKAMDKS
jgi:hypothetical protein